jgi:hypothetical protein
MKISKYQDYINEKYIYDMLKESRLVYSNKFINLLNKIKTDKVASILVSLYNKDVDSLSYNYIDITDDKSRVSFTPDRKVKEIIGDMPKTYEVIMSNRYLTHSDRNNRIFEMLGYDKNSSLVWSPSVGSIGQILAEVTSPVSGNVYCLFEEYVSDSPRKSVLNKIALQEASIDNPKVWTTSRNPVNIGRIARAILKSTNIEVSSKEIEDFVNKYKATFDFMSDASRQFDIINGNQIAYWYWFEHYKEGGGTLNNSCMSNVDEEFFDIYCYNSQVSLVVLYDDEGTISDDKYTSSKIKGRALLWDCKIDGTPAKFMDRVYTSDDSDVELFKHFAEKNGWWYKTEQSMYPVMVTDGNNSKNAEIIAELDEVKFDKYPYMDTMYYISTDNSTVSNSDDGADRIARETDGEWLQP